MEDCNNSEFLHQSNLYYSSPLEHRDYCRAHMCTLSSKANQWQKFKKCSLITKTLDLRKRIKILAAPSTPLRMK
jgi:hypothetical protein